MWSGMIFVVSSGPVGSVSKVYWYDFAAKSLAHVVEYGVLTVLLFRALKGDGVDKFRAGVGAIIIAIVYAVTDEVHQYFVPGRDSRFHDVFFDTIGAIVAVFIIWKLLPRMPKRLVSLAKKLDLS